MLPHVDPFACSQTMRLASTALAIEICRGCQCAGRQRQQQRGSSGSWWAAAGSVSSVCSRGRLPHVVVVRLREEVAGRRDRDSAGVVKGPAGRRVRAVPRQEVWAGAVAPVAVDRKYMPRPVRRLHRARRVVEARVILRAVRRLRAVRVAHQRGSSPAGGSPAGGSGGGQHEPRGDRQHERRRIDRLTANRAKRVNTSRLRL